jgi:hypothetical protein
MEAMVNSFQSILQKLLGKEVFVNLSIHDSSGRSGRILAVGTDYLQIGDGYQSYYIPFHAIVAVNPQEE